MLNTLKGDGFDCLLTLISIKMEHPRPLQVCTNICIIFAHTGAGLIRVDRREGKGQIAAVSVLDIFHQEYFKEKDE